MIITAPGKVVVWGEYAVLTGAPAAVMAIDRYAYCELSTSANFSSFTAHGFLTPGLHSPDRAVPTTPVTSLFAAILKEMGHTKLPSHLDCAMDTSAFYSSGTKMGLGSSAALSCAIYAGLCGILEHEPNWQEALRAHRAWQGGGGSGLDVAASWHGGVIRYQQESVAQTLWPENWHCSIVFTGSSASTPTQVAKFSAWGDSEKSSRLDALAQASENLFQQNPDLDDLRHYTSRLRELDRAGDLNIFTQEHERLATIAGDLDMVYKPCGAGGGDIGIAITENPQLLQKFCTQAALAGFTALDTEIAAHGIQTRENAD
ncbi:MAG: hypothetical protein GKR90_24655 [Pseudomonadales bacterium]|nr:hypothetical protein [Pseudomonadales bacterium]